MKLILPFLALSLSAAATAQTSSFVFLDCELKKDKNIQTYVPQKFSVKIDLKSKFIYAFENGRYKNVCVGKYEGCAVYEDAFTILSFERNIVENSEENIENEFRASISRYSGKIEGTLRSYKKKGNYGPRKLESLKPIFTGTCAKGVDLAPRKF
jgi:hypothetical protein